MFKNIKYPEIIGLIGIYGAYKYLWQPSTPVLRVPVKKSKVLASYSNDSDSESEYDDSSISESSDDYNIKFDQISEYDYE